MTKKKRQRKPAPKAKKAARKKAVRKKAVRKTAGKKAARKTSKRATTKKKKVARKKKTRKVLRRKPAAPTSGPIDPTDPDALPPFEDTLHEGDVSTRTDLLIDPKDLEAVALEASTHEQPGSTRQDIQTEAAPQKACPDSKKTPIQRDESRGAALSSSDPTQEADAREPETRDLTDDDPTQTECFDAGDDAEVEEKIEVLKPELKLGPEQPGLFEDDLPTQTEVFDDAAALEAVQARGEPASRPEGADEIDLSDTLVDDPDVAPAAADEIDLGETLVDDPGITPETADAGDVNRSLWLEALKSCLPFNLTDFFALQFHQ